MAVGLEDAKAGVEEGMKEGRATVKKMTTFRSPRARKVVAAGGQGKAKGWNKARE